MYVLTRQSLRDKPGLTQLAFTRLLAWLDDGDDSKGERYLEMRRRLVSYFQRRDRSDAEELVDETFNRIARTLGDCGVIETRPPARYCYVVAKFVFLEDIQHERRYVALDDTQTATRAVIAGDADEARTVQEQRLDCLDRCLNELSSTNRQFIVEYHEDVRGRKIAHRRDMAARMGISMNALAIRAWGFASG